MIDVGTDDFIGVLAYSVFSLILFLSPRVFQEIAWEVCFFQRCFWRIFCRIFQQTTLEKSDSCNFTPRLRSSTDWKCRFLSSRNQIWGWRFSLIIVKYLNCSEPSETFCITTQSDLSGHHEQILWSIAAVFSVALQSWRFPFHVHR